MQCQKEVVVSLPQPNTWCCIPFHCRPLKPNPMMEQLSPNQQLLVLREGVHHPAKACHYCANCGRNSIGVHCDCMVSFQHLQSCCMLLVVIIIMIIQNPMFQFHMKSEPNRRCLEYDLQYFATDITTINSQCVLYSPYYISICYCMQTCVAICQITHSCLSHRTIERQYWHFPPTHG